MKTIRWGMIGCGDVTERKSGPGFGKAEHSELVAVMRRNGALAADYARRHSVQRWHDDADGDHRREGHRRRLHRYAYGHALRLHVALRRGRQTRVRGKADGDESRRVSRHDRCLPRRRGSAVGRLLPARAAALSRRPRSRCSRHHRRRAHGRLASLPATPRRRSVRGRRRSLAGQSRFVRAAASSSRAHATRWTSWTSCSGRSWMSGRSPATRRARTDPKTSSAQRIVSLRAHSEAESGATRPISTRNTTRSWARAGASASRRRNRSRSGSFAARRSRRFRSPIPSTSTSR